jgi:hypothetical protein
MPKEPVYCLWRRAEFGYPRRGSGLDDLWLPMIEAQPLSQLFHRFQKLPLVNLPENDRNRWNL